MEKETEMSQLPVTLVTADATKDALQDSDYLGILSWLVEREGWSFQRLANESGLYSKAWWNLRYRQERPLDEDSKNALRRLTEGELPEQPPSVTAVTERMIHPDAAMYLVGELSVGERVRRVLMVAESDEITIYANGTVQAFLGHVDSVLTLDSAPAQEAAVTPVTFGVGANGEMSRRHKRYWRPCLPLDLQQRAEDAGLDVVKLIEDKLEEVTRCR